MTDDPWYPVTAHHPPPLAQVRGIVTVPAGGTRTYDSEIIISRGKPPHADKWASWLKGRATPLPAGVIPCLWQPQFPEKWQMPVPEPVPGVSPRMWSSSMRFQLVEEATAAELAADMERDREDARRGGGAEPELREPLQWWRDADKIRYEPAGQITPRMCEGRLMRAIATSGHGQELTIRYRSFGTILAEMAKLNDGAYATSDFIPRLQPLPADGKDFDAAMGWFVALNPMPLPGPRSRATWEFSRPQRCLVLRSFNIPISFAEIGNILDVSGEAARRMYDRAVRRACRIANGVEATDHDRQIEAIRERNRSFRLKARDPVSQIADALDALDTRKVAGGRR